LRLARQQIEEKEQEIEKLRKSFRYRLMCPHCGNLVTPAITEDNRLICPVCHNELRRITADGRLELIPSTSGRESGVLRESRARNNEEKAGENEGGTT